MNPRGTRATKNLSRSFVIVFVLAIVSFDTRAGQGDALEKAAESGDLAAASAALDRLAKDQVLASSFEFAMARAVVERERAITARALIERDDLERSVVIEKNSVWRYRKGLSAPPADWNAREFDDSSWESGPASIGFGGADDRTRLDDMQSKYSTLFLRRAFTVDEKSVDRVVGLRLEVMFDDGYAAYLNGHEIHRVHVRGRRGHPVDHKATATSQNAATKYEAFVVPATGLVAGENTLAFVGLNYTIASKDFSLDAMISTVSRAASATGEDWRRHALAASKALEDADDRAKTESHRRRVLLERAVVGLLLDDLERVEEDLTSAETLSAETLSGDGARALDYLRALTAMRSGRFVEAGRRLVRSASGGVESLDARSTFLLARVHSALDEWSEAERLYTSAIAKADASENVSRRFPLHEASLRRGVALFQLGERTKALESFAQIAKAKDASYVANTARLFQGVARVAHGNHSVAADELSKFANRTLDSELRSRALLWAGRATLEWYDSAESWAQGELKERTIDLFDRCGITSSSLRIERELLQARGEAFLRFGNVAGALDELEKIPAGDSERVALTTYRRVVALQKIGKYAESRKLCEEFRRLHPTSGLLPWFRLRQADAFFLTGVDSSAEELRNERLDAAIAGYREVIESGGIEYEDSAEARLGIALVLRGRFEAAERAFEGVDVEAAADAAPAGDHPVDAIAVPYLRARMLLGRLGSERRPRDARTASRIVNGLEQVEKWLVDFHQGQGISDPLRTKATIELAACLRRRGTLTAEKSERQRILRRAQGLVTLIRRRLGRRADAAGAYLEEARILVAMGSTSNAIKRYRSFVDEVPWKDSEIAPIALVELAELQRRTKKYGDALKSLSIARRTVPEPVGVFETPYPLESRIRLLAVRVGIESGDTSRLLPMLESHFRRVRALFGARGAIEGALLVRELEPEAAFDVLEKHESGTASLSSCQMVDLLLALTRRDLVEGGERLAGRLDRLVSLVGPNDSRFAEVESLRAAKLLAEDRYEEAQRVLEEAYAQVVDPAIEEELVLRLAFCEVFSDRATASKRFASLETKDPRLKSLASLGRSLVARIDDPDRAAANHAKAFAKTAKSSGRLVGGSYRSKDPERVARLARASAKETDSSDSIDRADVVAKELLAWPLVAQSATNFSRLDIAFAPSVTSSRDSDLEDDVRELRLTPFPVGELDEKDPLDFVDWLWIDPAPPVLPLVGGLSESLLRLVKISESQS